jgi:hypothetical protein
MNAVDHLNGLDRQFDRSHRGQNGRNLKDITGGFRLNESLAVFVGVLRVLNRWISFSTLALLRRANAEPYDGCPEN